MLSPAWRPFAKQLPESPLMRRTIAQYKPCQAGRKARFLFTRGGVSIPGMGGKQRGRGCVLNPPSPVAHTGAYTWHDHHAGHTSEHRHGTGTRKRGRSAISATSPLTTLSRHPQRLTHMSRTTSYLYTCGRTWNLIYQTSKHHTDGVTGREAMEQTEQILSGKDREGGRA